MLTPQAARAPAAAPLARSEVSIRMDRVRTERSEQGALIAGTRAVSV